ncbi:hypothetical protein ACROYT_G003526 [Oculina patagonica]
MMQISVKTLDSQTKVFEVSEECTVKEFKEQIASDVNIPPDKQRLIFKGKVLQDEKKLSEYGADGCVIHLVERKPTVPGASSQDGANGSSSSSSAPGGPPFGMGPNIVMGAFSMPVDVVGATQQIVQSLVNQLGVDSAQANISTTSSDDGSSVNVHINLQATTQPGNDVSQRINRARHFMRAAASCLNRTEGEGVLPMDTSDTPSTENSNQTQGTSTETGSQTATLASPTALAQILREARDSMTSMQTALDRYSSLLDTNTPENLGPSEDTLPDRVAESFHNLSHAYHALSDLTFNFRGPEPRRPSVLTSLSPHMPSVPMLSSFVGAPQMIRPQPAQQPHASSTAPQTTQPSSGGPQLPIGTNQNLRIHVNPQGGISFTTIISNTSNSGTAAPVNTQSTPSTTSTSGTRMSASADNGAARETFSSSFGEQRSSVGTNTNGSSTSTSTQTSQPSVRTRIIVDDFIALISNVPASMAAAAAAAQGQVPPGMPGAQNLSQMQGQGAATATTTGQPQPQAQSVPTPGAQGTTPGQQQQQARPQGLPVGMHMNLMSGMPQAANNSNHPDPSLPCQSFHFGPQGQRAQPQQASQQSSQSTTSTTSTSGQAQTPVTSAAQNQTQTREGGSEQTANPVNPSPAQERPRPPPDSRRRARERTISPADLQGILGMMAHDARTGTRGFPPFFPRGSSRGTSRQSSGPMTASETRRSMMEFLDSVMSDIHSHGEGGGQTQTINSLIQTMRASGLDIQDEEGLVAALYQRLSAVMTIEDVMGVVVGSEAPFERMQPALMLYVKEDLLQGKEPSHENINTAVAELTKEIVDGVADSLRSVPTKDNIDIVESAQSFLEHYIGNAVSLVLHSEDNPRFAEYFQGHMKDIAAEFFTMLVFCYRDGLDGVERVIRNRLPQSTLTAEMDEQSREMFVQVLLRNIRQMYYSRAYCEGRLQRFMIRASPPQPPSQPQAPPQPQASSETQAPVRPTAEESTAVDGKADGAIDDEMDSHGSDDSETFTTPPGSVTAGTDSDRLQTECPEGDEAMEDENKDDDWKTIMPEEWIPVITTDIVRQRRMPPQAPFSDAYINGLPPKRRKMVDQRGVTPSEDSIGDALKQAAAATGATPLTSLEDLSKAAKGNRKLHGAYRREIKKEVKTRLEKDTDYRPDRFPQTRDYFDKDTQRN